MPSAQNDYLLTQSAIMQCGVLLGDTADLYARPRRRRSRRDTERARRGQSTYTATPMEHSLARHILPAIPNGCALLFLTARTRKGSESWCLRWHGHALRLQHRVRARRRLFQPAGHCARPPDGSGAASTHQPIKGIAQDADGVLHDVTIDPASLAYLSTTDSLYYR